MDDQKREKGAHIAEMLEKLYPETPIPLNHTDTYTLLVAVVLSAKGTQTLLKESAAVQFVMDAFGHLKAIGSTEAARPLLEKAGVVPDGGITDLGASFVEAAGKRFFAREPSVRTLA